jgi:hypothetical protein
MQLIAKRKSEFLLLLLKYIEMCSYFLIYLNVVVFIIIAISFYESLIANASILPLTIFVCLFLLSVKYGLRVIKIVGWQKYNEDNEINNNKKKAWGQ